MAEVVDLESFTLRRTYLGAQMRAQRGYALEDELLRIDNEGPFGGWEVSYRRCVRLREPSYESMRFGLGEGMPTRFERLLLPCVDNDQTKHHLVSVVIFQNFPMPN